MLMFTTRFAMKSLSTKLTMAARGGPDLRIQQGRSVVSKQCKKLINSAGLHTLHSQTQNLVLQQQRRKGVRWHARLLIIHFPIRSITTNLTGRLTDFSHRSDFRTTCIRAVSVHEDAHAVLEEPEHQGQASWSLYNEPELYDRLFAGRDFASEVCVLFHIHSCNTCTNGHAFLFVVSLLTIVSNFYQHLATPKCASAAAISLGRLCQAYSGRPGWRETTELRRTWVRAFAKYLDIPKLSC